MARSECLDVSPRYGGTNQLDGLALLALQQELPGQFIGRAKMGITPNLLTIYEICERLSGVSGAGSADFDGGTILRDLLHRNARETLRDETLRLRVLCSLAASGGDASLARTWPSSFLKIMNGVIDIQVTGEWRSNENNGIRKAPFELRQRMLIDIGKQFLSRIERAFSDAKEMIETLEALSAWLTVRKRGAIQATPRTFEENLARHLPDRESLQRCSTLGLAVFSIAQLSSGETAIAVFSAALHGALKMLDATLKEGEPFLLLIDEGEMFLHPKWQREYIGRIVNLVAAFPRIAGNAHLLISSHSLIVAADTPPNCLIDIDKSTTINGFGLGPKGLLERIYNVEELSGDYTHPALAGLAEYFTDSKKKITANEALLTAKALADENVRDYLIKRIEEDI